MPYAIEKVKLPREYDRRVKLTDGDKLYIKLLYDEGKSIRGIARIYKDICCRTTIQNVLFPEKYKEKVKKGKLHRKKVHHYYDKKRHCLRVRETRRYKQQLRKEGKI